jgi:DNA polymerase-4
MPIRMAQRLCPDAKIIRGDHELYSKLSHTVTEVIQEKVPVMEKASIDEFYLDLSGMDQFFGCYKWTVEIASAVTRETGLPISFALSSNKTVSKIGTGEAKPVGRLEISPPEIRPFLNPLSIRKIPGVGDATFKLLSRVGVRTIHTLSEMPVQVLQQMIGVNGGELWKKANGIDENPVIPYSERKSISMERTFTNDTMDVAELKRLITGMAEQLAHQLRKEKWLTSTVVIKIRYANFDTETKQCKIAYTSADHIISRAALDLFDKAYSRRMRLRLVGLRLTNLVHGCYQMNLFEDTAEVMSLYQTIDKIKDRFGAHIVGRASGFDFGK